MPGLVALYDIRPGNGAGLFLQPGNPHGARDSETVRMCVCVHVRVNIPLSLSVLCLRGTASSPESNVCSLLQRHYNNNNSLSG